MPLLQFMLIEQRRHGSVFNWIIKNLCRIEFSKKYLQFYIAIIQKIPNWNVGVKRMSFDFIWHISERHLDSKLSGHFLNVLKSAIISVFNYPLQYCWWFYSAKWLVVWVSVASREGVWGASAASSIGSEGGERSERRGSPDARQFVAEGDFLR